MAYIALGTALLILFLVLKRSSIKKIPRIVWAFVIILGVFLLLRLGLHYIAFISSAIIVSFPYIRRFLPLILSAIRWRSKFKQHSSRKVYNQQSYLTLSEAREILGVDRNASKKEIKEAYQKLMKTHHPDKGGSKYFASKLNEAKDLLLHS